MATENLCDPLYEGGSLTAVGQCLKCKKNDMTLLDCGAFVCLNCDNLEDCKKRNDELCHMKNCLVSQLM